MNFCDVVGRRRTDLALQMGLLFPGRDALRMGLVDELAPSAEELRQAALKKLDQFLKVPGACWKGWGRGGSAQHFLQLF